MTSRTSSPGEQLEVPHPPARVSPDGCVYQAGIRKVYPVPTKKTPANLHPCFVFEIWKISHGGDPDQLTSCTINAWASTKISWGSPPRGPTETCIPYWIPTWGNVALYNKCEVEKHISPDRFGWRCPNISRDGNLSQPTVIPQHQPRDAPWSPKLLCANLVYVTALAMKSVFYSIVITISVISLNAFPSVFMKSNFVFEIVDIGIICQFLPNVPLERGPLPSSHYMNCNFRVPK